MFSISRIELVTCEGRVRRNLGREATKEKRKEEEREKIEFRRSGNRS